MVVSSKLVIKVDHEVSSSLDLIYNNANIAPIYLVRNGSGRVEEFALFEDEIRELAKAITAVLTAVQAEVDRWATVGGTDGR